MFEYFVSAVTALVSPGTMVAAISRCTINGRPVDCGNFIGPFLGLMGGFMIIWLALLILIIAANWKIYTKAGKPGWSSIIPIYNIVVLLDIVGKPLWWVILLFIPIVNFFFMIIVLHRLAKSFGKDIGYTIGLILLNPIFVCILGFGKSVYQRISDGQTSNLTPTAQ